MNNHSRNDMSAELSVKSPLQKDEQGILYLASLAPSGHNTQPWFVTCLEPFHWIVGNDENRWLPAVDPTQRKTVLSIGAFLQNLEYAAGHYGYARHIDIFAKNNQDESIAELRLKKEGKFLNNERRNAENTNRTPIA